MAPARPLCECLVVPRHFNLNLVNGRSSMFCQQSTCSFQRHGLDLSGMLLPPVVLMLYKSLVTNQTSAANPPESNSKQK